MAVCHHHCTEDTTTTLQDTTTTIVRVSLHVGVDNRRLHRRALHRHLQTARPTRAADDTVRSRGHGGVDESGSGHGTWYYIGSLPY